MEVHPPEHPIFTWKQFFIHMATVCLGLLTALGLEQTVEYLHHRHEGWRPSVHNSSTFSISKTTSWQLQSAPRSVLNI
jgi:hypothetical protein